MNAPAVSTASAPVAPAVSPWLVTAGILFILVWGAVCLLVMSLSLMGTLMANDSGAASTESHGLLIAAVFGGQVLTGLAGIPAGLAFFWRRKRALMLWLFAILLVLGLAGQAIAFATFLG